MPVGFPATRSGVEIRILERLFSPRDAEIALELSAIPEPAAAIHKRLKHKLTLAELTAALEDMASRGIILGFSTASGTRYSKMIFAIGIYERQVNRLTAELERDARQYSEEAFGEAFHRKGTTQMRIVPVNQAIPVERSVATYDSIRAFVEASPGPFAKMPCICRRGHDLMGEPCKQTSQRENCLTIGKGAESMARSGAGTPISKEEMLALLEEADKEGLVLQPENTKNPLFVCCCCGCCCGVLTSAKRFARPAEYFSSNYYAGVDAEACDSCGACETRCQMEAIASTDSGVKIDLTRCIGCALCVTSCPSGALQLKAKETPRVPPPDTTHLYMKLLEERYGPWGFARIGIRKALGVKF